MADIMTPEQRSALMARIRGADTKPELAVRRALHAQGYRYRIHVRDVPGRPDLVFAKRRSAVFVHGCFWHRHDCARATTPKSRQDYWLAKFSANVERDKRNEQRLAADGWRVFVAWECEIERDETLMDRLVGFLGPPRLGKVCTQLAPFPDPNPLSPLQSNRTCHPNRSSSPLHNAQNANSAK